MAYLFGKTGHRTVFPRLPSVASSIKKQRLLPLFFWSERQDLNLRPLGPEPSALPNCATPRFYFFVCATKRTSCLDIRSLSSRASSARQSPCLDTPCFSLYPHLPSRIVASLRLRSLGSVAPCFVADHFAKIAHRAVLACLQAALEAVPCLDIRSLSSRASSARQSPCLDTPCFSLYPPQAALEAVPKLCHAPFLLFRVAFLLLLYCLRCVLFVCAKGALLKLASLVYHESADLSSPSQDFPFAGRKRGASAPGLPSGAKTPPAPPPRGRAPARPSRNAAAPPRSG